MGLCFWNLRRGVSHDPLTFRRHALDKYALVVLGVGRAEVKKAKSLVNLVTFNKKPSTAHEDMKMSMQSCTYKVVWAECHCRTDQ